MSETKERSIIVTQHLATIGTRKQTEVEVNMCSYKERPALLDIRQWRKEDGKPLNGIALYDDEVEELRNLLNEITLFEELAEKEDL